MAHCIECEYRQSLRRIKALPAEATRRIKALRRAAGVDNEGRQRKIDRYALTNMGHSLHEWAYGAKGKELVDGTEEMANRYVRQTTVIIDLVHALAEFEEHIKLF